MIRHKLRYYFQESTGNLRRSGFSGVASIGMMTIALLFLGVFFIVQENLGRAAVTLKGKFEIIAFLRDSVPEDKAQGLASVISQREGVKKVLWVSKEKAFLEFSADPEMKTLLQASGGNPLPASYTIQIMEEFDDSQKIQELLSWLRGQSFIEEVSFGQAEIERLIKIIKVMHLIGLTVAFALILASLFMVVSTVRLMVDARRDEVEIMRLFGASRWFIQGPFLLEGMFQGLISGGLAVGLIFLLGHLIVFQVKSNIGISLVELLPVPATFLTLTLSLEIIGAGILLGAIGSFLGARSFLGRRA